MTTLQNETKPTPTGIWIAATIAIVFGALSVWSGGRALFGGPDLQAAVGNAVPFVLWFNFLSGFVYVVAGLGIALRKDWANLVSVGLTIAIIAVFALFGWFALSGGAYEIRTLGAMVLRAGVWIGIVLYLRRLTAAQQSNA